MILLIAAVTALVGGPLLEYGTRRTAAVMAALDGLLLVTIVGLVGLDLVPEAIDARDWWSAACFLAGLALPMLLERRQHRALAAGRSMLAVVALTGAAVHQLADGGALRVLAADAGSERAQLLAVGVAAHQLPVGLATAWALRHQSSRLTAGVFALLVSCTVMGYLLADRLALSPTTTMRVVALIAGFVVHVLVHDRPEAPTALDRATARRADGWGAMAGALLLVVMALAGRIATDERTAAIVRRFLDLLIDSAPALVLAYAITGLLAVVAPSTSFAWIARGSRLSQALKGIVVGLPLPLCSCSVVPLYQRLSVNSGSVAGATAFLLAGPELGMDAVLMSLPLLGGRIALLRIACAIVVALTVALLVGRLAERGGALRPVLPLAEHVERRTWREAGMAMLRVGFVDAVGHTAPWILMGIAAAAMLGPTPAASWLASLPVAGQVLALTLAGVPTYICASAATPLVATLGAGGVSMGAGLAFLITGPATNVTTFGVMARLHGRRFAMVFLSSVVGVTVALGCAIAMLWPQLAPPPPPTPTLESHSIIDLAATLVLLVAIARTVAHRGLRGFLAELRPSHAHAHGKHVHHAHDHGCAHDHAHDHAHEPAHARLT